MDCFTPELFKEKLHCLKQFRTIVPPDFVLASMVCDIIARPLLLSLLENSLLCDVRPGDMYGTMLDMRGLPAIKTDIMDWLSTEMLLLSFYNQHNLAQYRSLREYGLTDDGRYGVYSRKLFYYYNCAECLTVDMKNAITDNEYGRWFDLFCSKELYAPDAEPVDMFHDGNTHPALVVDLANASFLEDISQVRCVYGCTSADIIHTPYNGCFARSMDGVELSPKLKAVVMIHSLHMLSCGSGVHADLHFRSMIVAITDYLALQTYDYLKNLPAAAKDYGAHARISEISREGAFVSMFFVSSVQNLIKEIVTDYTAITLPYPVAPETVFGFIMPSFFCYSGYENFNPEPRSDAENSRTWIKRHVLAERRRNTETQISLLHRKSVHITEPFMMAISGDQGLHISRAAPTYYGCLAAAPAVLFEQCAKLCMSVRFVAGGWASVLLPYSGAIAVCKNEDRCTYICDYSGQVRHDDLIARHLVADCLPSRFKKCHWLVRIGNASMVTGYTTPVGRIENGWCKKSSYVLGRRSNASMNQALNRLREEYGMEMRIDRYIEVMEHFMGALPAKFRESARLVRRTGVSVLHSQLICFSYLYACLSVKHRENAEDALGNGAALEYVVARKQAVEYLPSV